MEEPKNSLVTSHVTIALAERFAHEDQTKEDGRASAQADVTPLVVEVTPGEHVLLFRRKGFRMLAHRVVAKVGKDQSVSVTLEPEPAPCEKPSPPAPVAPEPPVSRASEP